MRHCLRFRIPVMRLIFTWFVFWPRKGAHRLAIYPIWTCSLPVMRSC